MATPARRAPRTDRPAVAACALALALIVLMLVVRLGGALSPSAVPGLTQADAVTKTGLAIARLGVHVTSALTVGWLAAAAVLVPGAPAATRRCLRAAARAALGWALCALTLMAFSVSDLFGVPALTGVTGGLLRTFAADLPQGRALVLVIAVAAALAVAARLPAAEHRPGHLLLCALAGLLPPLFTGHAAGSAHHALAVHSLAAHVAGAALWAGGLVALVLLAPDVRDRLPGVAARYSTLALVAFAVVGVSGAVQAWIRLGGVHLDSRYGALVAAKAVAFAVLGAMGWWHRRRTIPALPGGGLARLAAAEIIVMAATMALATGLARTPPPEVAPGTLDAVTLRLGFPLPGPPGVSSLLPGRWFDPLFAVLVGAGAVLYGVRAVRRRDLPSRRVLAWTAGLAVVLLATCGGLARYSMVLFSANAVQHVMVGVLGPLLLVRGAPPEPPRRAPRPAVAVPLFFASLYLWYLTPLFGPALSNHALHSVALAGFLTIGVAFFAATSGTWWPLATLPVHVLGGLLLSGSGSVFGGGWYGTLGRAWGAPLPEDQRLGIWLLCGLAALATLPACVATVRRGRGRE
ncbi:cytochrome c oxidase assembly protein [Spirillospora albida]|uniref:cytochrome c oxidase assembly protein n=1 Tax=Spirillospora albida TaxID=58123 RepID=UPI00068FEEB7|nr:cytochrome c oxidase assembly protein [Spirillospora albida]